MPLDPDLGPSAGWRPLEPAPERSFVSGEPDGHRLRVRYYTDEDHRVIARVWFGPGAEGPPGHAHGGAIAAALDEAMGVAVWVAGHPMVAGRLVTDFRRMVPLGTVATIYTEVHGVEGRKVRVTARLVATSDAPHAEGEAVFVRLDLDTLQALNDLRNAG
jgi:acyl-coenzyme A thioesterase PaaI-like protein